MDEIEVIEGELSRTHEPDQRLALIFKLSAMYWRTDQQKMLEVLKEAVELARESNNQPMLLQGIWHAGTCYRALLKEDLALEHFKESLAIAVELGLQDKQARILNSLGILYQNTSKFATAIDYFEQARVLGRECGDFEIEALAVNNIGVCTHELGKYSEALQYYLEAGRLFEKAQGKPHSGIIKAMGGLAMEVGDTESALKHFLQALRLLESQENHREKAPLLTDMGTAYAGRGEFDLAFKNYEEALKLSSMAGDRSQTIVLLCMMSNFFFTTNSFKKGWEALEQAHEYLQESHAELLKSMILHFEGVGYKAQKDFLKAEDALEKSLAISRKIGNTKLICSALCLIGLTFEEQKDHERSYKAMREAIDIAEKNNYKGEEYYTAYEALCRFYEATGDLQNAIVHYKKFYELKKEQAKLQSELATSVMLVEFEMEKTRQQSESYRLENIALADANARLLALGEERKEFISIAAHDLKNPLYSIKMLLNFLKSRGTPSQEEVTEVLGDIETATISMLHLIQNLLDAEIIENGRLQLYPVAFSPVDMLQHVVQRYKSAANTKKIKVNLELDKKAVVFADTQHFMQALDNILSNAIKYSPFEKSIYIRL
ncbi:MAG: tetratricopeptide repeat protein, partial [Bacteroidota bacterium]